MTYRYSKVRYSFKRGVIGLQTDILDNSVDIVVSELDTKHNVWLVLSQFYVSQNINISQVVD